MHLTCQIYKIKKTGTLWTTLFILYCTLWNDNVTQTGIFQSFEAEMGRKRSYLTGWERREERDIEERRGRGKGIGL